MLEKPHETHNVPFIFRISWLLVTIITDHNSYFFPLLYSVSKSGNIETFPYSLPTDHSLHPNAVQSRVTLAGNDGMTHNAQSRSQFRCPEEKVQSKKETSETSRSPASKVILRKHILIS